MKSNWNYPTTVWVGNNRIIEINSACKSLKIKKPLFVTDKDLAGLDFVKNIIKIIEKEFKNLNIFSNFSGNPNGDDVDKGVKEFKKNKKIEGYILDLRNNPGGLLGQAIKISDFFLDDGEIVSTKGRKKNENQKWFAREGDIINGKALIVLINKGSASASEIVAGALKDHKRAVLVGEKSYGKGSVQSIIPLKNRGAIRLTISKYYLPSGKSISEVGVTPDITVEEESDDFRILSENDNQLKFARKLFTG